MATKAHVSLLACALIAAASTARAGVWPAEVVSFAYPFSHPVVPLSSSAIAKMVSTDGQDSDDADVFDDFSDTPIDVRIGAPRAMSRSGMCGAVVAVARAYDLPLPFFANLIWQESGFDVGSISRAGALGVAQFMPQTAYEYGLVNPFEPIHALYASAKFLRRLQTQFGNLGLAAMAYNAGSRRVTDWMARKGALPGETRNYVVRITGNPAEQWNSAEFARGPEAALMPAKAPCAEVAEAVAEQAHVTRVARLMSELAAATRPPAPPKVELVDVGFDEDRAQRVVRLILKNRGDRKTHKVAEKSAKQSIDKSVKRAWDKIADRTMRKAAEAFAKASPSERRLAAR